MRRMLRNKLIINKFPVFWLFFIFFFINAANNICYSDEMIDKQSLKRLIQNYTWQVIYVGKIVKIDSSQKTSRGDENYITFKVSEYLMGETKNPLKKRIIGGNFTGITKNKFYLISETNMGINAFIPLEKNNKHLISLIKKNISENIKKRIIINKLANAIIYKMLKK